MNAPETFFAESPAETVRRIFERIDRERMHDVPLCNRALEVEAVGFRHWEGLWVGVVITPWAMNLMLLPAGNESFSPLRVGQEHEWAFPSGAYPFMGNHEPGLGEYHYCSLFSPMDDFIDQAVAREVAEASLNELFVAPEPETPPQPQPLDRRAFLRKALGRKDAE